MTPRSYGRKTIRPEMTVRQIAADFPASVEVFRQHGEQEAPPARFGHHEPLTHFASRRGISLKDLLRELAGATKVPVELHGQATERIHHVFILSALALTLTLGAGWGAWLLWQIGEQSRFTAVPDAYVIAHGEAQLWGFIVLFVMGISLRTVLHGAVRLPLGIWLGRGLCALVVAGICGSVLWSVFPQAFFSLGLVSSVMLLVLSFGFWGVQCIMLAAKWRATWARAVLLSGVWLIVWAAITAGLRLNARQHGPDTYTDGERLLLIHLAVFGFAMNSIYGFGQMLLPGLLRIGSVRGWAIELAHWLHNFGVIIVCLTTWVGGSAYAMVAGSIVLVSGAVLFAVGHRGFVGRRRTFQGEEKGHASLDLYPPLAFFWLLAALMLMTAGTLYEATTDAPLDHAFMGAVRHALTVGFMTTLILGVGQRILPVLDHTILAFPTMTIPILALIGVGNLLRVGSELAILYAPAAYAVMPISALLEWTALLLFTVNMAATMFRRDPLLKRGQVTIRSSLAVLLAQHPWIEDRLRPTGTRYLERTRSVPEELTVGSFAASEGFNSDELVKKINAWLTEGPSANLDSMTCSSELLQPEECRQ